MVKKKRKKTKGDYYKSRNISKDTRRDFEVFAKGVERLEQIRDELRSFDTKKYGSEVSSIKSKLNNVSYIPEIEKELIDLKAKINGTYKKEPNTAHMIIHRKINELKEKIPVEHAQMNRKINELKESVPDKEKINNKLRELEDELEKKREVRKQLSKEEVKFVKNIPNIKSQLASFKDFLEKQHQEEQRKKEMLTKIDPDVNLLVNNRFNLTLGEIKAELSEKLKNKELDIQKQLQKDLEERKKKFVKQYKELESEFGKKYKERIKLCLDKEVSDKFNNILDKRVDNIREKLKSEFKSEERELKSVVISKERKLEEERKNIYNELNKKKGILEREYKSNLEKEKKNLKEHFDEEILVHRTILDKKMTEYLTNKTREIRQKYENKEKIDVAKIIKEEADKIKSQLKKEFDQKLKLEINATNAEFEKKKSVLALEIQDKARKLFD